MTFHEAVQDIEGRKPVAPQPEPLQYAVLPVLESGPEPKIKVAAELLKCILLAFLCSAILAGTVLLWRLPKLVHNEAEATRLVVAAQLHEATVDANDRLADALAAFDKQLGTLNGTVDNTLAPLPSTLDQQMTTLNGTLAKTLAPLPSTLDQQMTTLNGMLAKTLSPVEGLGEQLNSAAPLWLDCEFNPDCAFNRYQGVSKAFEKTALVIAAEAPAMAVSVDKIAKASADTAVSVAATSKEVSVAAKAFNTPQTKMQQIRSWLLTIARIYGAI